MHIFISLLVLIVSVSFLGRADEAASFSLDFPVDCRLHENCYIQNHVDVHQDSTPNDPKDYTCGSLVYQGHKGVDFRLRTYKDLERKVRVLAAADGVVKGTRNDVEEFLPLNSPKIKDKECGNGIVIDHGNGWETQYCHMKKGSILVVSGQKVLRGDTLGFIGMSGKTEFPHVHLSIRKDGKVVDPFIGIVDKNTKCGGDLHLIWSKSAQKQVLPYQSTGVLGSGFTESVPSQESVMKGDHQAKKLDAKIEKFIFWVYLYGVQKDDEEEFTIFDPNDKIIFKKRMKSVRANKATWLTFVGKKVKVIPSRTSAEKNEEAKNGLEPFKKFFGTPEAEHQGSLVEGTYTGKYRLIRKDKQGKEQVVIDLTRKVDIHF